MPRLITLFLLSLSFSVFVACADKKDSVEKAAPAPSNNAETLPRAVKAEAPVKLVEVAKPEMKPEATQEHVELTEEVVELVKVLYAEGIGPIKMDMLASEVIAAMGKPKSKDKESRSEATGDLREPWKYKGARLAMVRESKRTTHKVGEIYVEAPSDLATKRGIRIGSTRADVEKAYAKERNAEESDEAIFVAGSVYDGLIISFENDVVTKMFLGAAAE